MNKIKEKFISFYNSENPTKIEYGFVILVCFIMLITYAYNDLKSLTIWSTNILDVVYDFKIQDYFSYTALNIYNAPHQYVSGTVYNLIPWAIWNIPIWIMQRFFNNPILFNPISLIYSNMFLVACLVFTLYFTYKIVMKLTNDLSKAKWVIFLSLSFIYTLIGIFYAGQTDIMISLLSVMGLYFLIEKKEKYFLILSSFAISIKYFFFFPYIAIILLTEKKISKIFYKLFIGLIPTIASFLVFHFMPMYSVSSEANPFYWMINDFVNGFVVVNNGNTLSMFILGLLFIYFMSYITKVKDEKEKIHYIIYLIVASYSMIFMFSTYEFYRMILLMPFIYILFSLSKRWNLNIILETVLSLTSIFLMINHNQNYFFSNVNSLNGGLLASMLNITNFNDYSVYMVANSIPFYGVLSSVASSILVGVFIIILVINHPRFKDSLIQIKDDINVRGLIWLRLFIIVPFIMYNIIMLLR
ncbi:MAG: hypothetical protein PHD02_04295 [Bacilli bacterium]|nr:hypothetical protein [Bacilli bacterium]